MNKLFGSFFKQRFLHQKASQIVNQPAITCGISKMCFDNPLAITIKLKEVPYSALDEIFLKLFRGQSFRPSVHPCVCVRLFTNLFRLGNFNYWHKITKKKTFHQATCVASILSFFIGGLVRVRKWEKGLDQLSRFLKKLQWFELCRKDQRRTYKIRWPPNVKDFFQRLFPIFQILLGILLSFLNILFNAW